MGTNTQIVRVYLAEHGPSTSRDVARSTGLTVQNVDMAFRSLIKSGAAEQMLDRVPAKWTCRGLRIVRLAEKKLDQKCCVWELLPYQKAQLVAESDAFISKLRAQPIDPFTLLRMHLGG